MAESKTTSTTTKTKAKTTRAKSTKTAKAVENTAIDIRFKLSETEGKLYNMVDTIDKKYLTEFVKEAMFYYLQDVRDKKVESKCVEAKSLKKFAVDVKEEQNSFTLNDMLEIFKSIPQPQAAPMQYYQPVQVPVGQQQLVQPTQVMQPVEQSQLEPIKEDIKEDNNRVFILDDNEIDDF